MRPTKIYNINSHYLYTTNSITDLVLQSADSSNSFGITVKSIIGSNNYFAIMSRNSARVALVAIRSPESPPGYPIYHATYLNMRFPLCTGDLALGSSNGEATLCIACQQDLPGGQAGICKYSMNLSSVIQNPSAVFRGSRPQSGTQQESGASALLKSMLRPGSPSTSISTPATTGVTGTSSALMSMLNAGRESAMKDLKSMISSAVPERQIMTVPAVHVSEDSKKAEKAIVATKKAMKHSAVALVGDDSSEISEDSKKAKKAIVATKKAAKHSAVALAGDDSSEISEDSKKAEKSIVATKKAVKHSAVALAGKDMEEEGFPSLDQRFFKTTLKEQAKAIRSALREDLKAQEATLKELFKEEMAKTSAEEIVNSLEKKLHATVATEVKHQLKTAMDSSFKKAFEGSLLPAFQAGTAKMFGQVQASFESGMQRLIDHSASVQAGQIREISALKTEMAALKSSTHEILKAIKAGGGVGPVKVAVTRVSELLEAQRFIDAVEFALEKKDLYVLVEVLTYGPFTPTRFAEECRTTDTKNRAALLQLCLLQQVLYSKMFASIFSSKSIDFLRLLFIAFFGTYCGFSCFAFCKDRRMAHENNTWSPGFYE
jgi:hypothetical protein